LEKHTAPIFSIKAEYLKTRDIVEFAAVDLNSSVFWIKNTEIVDFHHG
jgi:hypothetical protein